MIGVFAGKVKQLMSKQRRNKHDNSLEDWQEWTSHNPGYWRASGRIPPTGHFGRRPTKAGYAFIVLGMLRLGVALAILVLDFLTVPHPPDTSSRFSVAGIPAIFGAILVLYGWRVAHPVRTRTRRRRHR